MKTQNEKKYASYYIYIVYILFFAKENYVRACVCQKKVVTLHPNCEKNNIQI